MAWTLNYAIDSQEIMREYLVFILKKGSSVVFLPSDTLDRLIVSYSLKYSSVSPEQSRKSDFISHSHNPLPPLIQWLPPQSAPPTGLEKHDFPTTSISWGLFSSMVVRVDWLPALPMTEFYYWDGIVRRSEAHWDKEMDAAMWMKSNRISLLPQKKTKKTLNS